MGRKLTKIGVWLWIYTQIAATLLTGYYLSSGATKPPVFALMLYGVSMIITTIAIVVGGFLNIGASYGAKSARNYISAFAQEGTKVIKMPIIIALLLIVLFLLWAGVYTLL